jgi:predicted amidohydrolase YtcJ
MLEPYADGSGSCGARNFEQGLFDELVTRCDANGGHVAVHAIGDGAVRATLDGFAAARAANGSRDSRHRIEHIEVLHPNDLNRFLSLGVIASVQPVHASFIYDLNNPWIRKVGAERLLHGMVWRKLLTHGVPLALGSDWPVASYDPRMGIHAAVTRGRFSQHADVRDQRLTLHETLYGFTVAGAYAEFQESVKGVLQPGYLADLILIDRDWFQCPPEQILDTRVFMTMLGGTIVYEE